MPTPRRQQVSLADTPYYHCISRCVRRAFLCGEDSVSGKSFEHRRSWIEDRLLFLGCVFSIDICAYAVMSNHVHVVLHVDEQGAQDWSMQDVLERWHRIHKGTLFTQQYARGEKLEEFAFELVKKSVETYRQRLCDISWFMKELNEPIARMANQEDECTGRFWEGRFKSQALLNESALLACMAYVDLNPIRADIESTPETSHYTSIKKRIKTAKEQGQQPITLYPFLGYENSYEKEVSDTSQQTGLSFRLTDYLELVDLTGRSIRTDKSGSIDLSLAPILQRIGLTSEQWLTVSTQFEANFSNTAVGNEDDLTRFYQNTQRERRHNIASCRRWLT